MQDKIRKEACNCSCFSSPTFFVPNSYTGSKQEGMAGFKVSALITIEYPLRSNASKKPFQACIGFETISFKAKHNKPIDIQLPCYNEYSY